MRRLAALWLLAVSLLVTLLRRWGSRSTELARFRADFSPEGLVAVSPEERRVLAAAGRCLACGLCDRGEGARRAAAGGAYPGVMALVLASSRTLWDLRAAAEGFHYVPEEVLRDKEEACPAHVPLEELARVTMRRGE